jgi:hypothetical protein
VAEQEAFGVLDVVAALDPDPGGEQARVDLGRRTPDPTTDLRPGGDSRDKVGLMPNLPSRLAVRMQRDKRRPATLVRPDRPPLIHTRILTSPTDTSL